jgi:hypothetical protein
LFQTEILGVARIQGFQEPVWREWGDAGGVTQAKTGIGPSNVGAGSSRDPVIMEET